MGTKEPLQRILVFGAGGHIGGPLAEKVRREAPDVLLRLVTHRVETAAELSQRFPKAEVVVASYFDLPSLLDAFAGVDGCFVVTPDFLDEEVAMTNVVAAIRHHGQLRHMVRLVADPIGMTMERVPDTLKGRRDGRPAPAGQGDPRPQPAARHIHQQRGVLHGQLPDLLRTADPAAPQAGRPPQSAHGLPRHH